MSKRTVDSPLDNRRKQKKNRLPLSTMQKVELLQKLDRGVSVMRLTVEYGVGTTTIYDLKRQRDKLLEFYTECNDRRFLKNRKKNLEAKNEELERALIEWVRQQRRERFPLTGSMVLNQARKYHQELNIQGEGEYSENWLQKFIKRHNIKYQQISGEMVSVEDEDTEEIILNNQVSQKDLIKSGENKNKQLYQLLIVHTNLLYFSSICYEAALFGIYLFWVFIYSNKRFITYKGNYWLC